jgi:hypothetical protein
MIAKREVVALLWDGAATVRAAQRAMKKRASVQITLPQGTHHALFQHLNPGAARGTPENFDTEGGAEMLARIATVAGLEALGKLERAVRLARYRVQLSTPDPVLILAPPDSSERAR